MKLHTTPTNEDLTRLAQDILVELRHGLVTGIKFSTNTKVVVYVSDEGFGKYTVDVISRNNPGDSSIRQGEFSYNDFNHAEVSHLVSLLEETAGKFTRFQ